MRADLFYWDGLFHRSLSYETLLHVMIIDGAGPTYKIQIW